MRSDEVSRTGARVGVGLAAIVLLVLLAFPSAGAEVRYRVTEIGTLGGDESGATGVNASGQVCGTATDASGVEHTFLWEDGTMTDLHWNASWDFSMGADINRHGMVAGWAHVSTNTTGKLWNTNAGTVEDLGMPTGAVGSFAEAVNDDNVVVGVYHTERFTYPCRAYVWTSLGGIQDIGTLGGDEAAARDINSSNQITGWSLTSSGERHVFLYQNLSWQDLGSFGGPECNGLGINDAGEIVGWAEIDNGDRHAFFWGGSGPLQDIGTLGGPQSQAMRINSLGEAVGWAEIDNGEKHAFLYSGGAMIDLNDLIPEDSGWLLENARDINDDGWIAGSGTIGGQTHAWMLTPIPEPATVSTLLLGVGVLGLLRRRRT